MTAHARLSPSAATRWMICPGSVTLIERLIAAGRLPARSSSEAAAEGTVAHQVREWCLDLGLDPYDFVGVTWSADGYTFVVDDEMAQHLAKGQDWILEQSGELVVEHQVNLEKWLPGQFGTLDTAIINRKTRTLIIFDLKYGAGVVVDAVMNKQLRIYGLGVVDNFNLYDLIDNIVIVIDQPRAGGLKTWEITLEELLAFGDDVEAAGRAVFAPNAPLVASDAGCYWCPVKDMPEGCPAYDKMNLDMFGPDVFEDLDDEPVLPDTPILTPTRRGYIIRHAPTIKRWLAKLHDDALEAALRGEPDPGMKAVPGQRGDRKFADAIQAEVIAVDAMGDEAYKKSLVGIPALEKALKPGKRKLGNPDAWGKLEKLITQDEGRPILVPADDPRPALTPLVDEFEDLD